MWRTELTTEWDLDTHIRLETLYKSVLLLVRNKYSWLSSVAMSQMSASSSKLKYMKHLQRSFPWMKMSAMKASNHVLAIKRKIP